MAVCMFVHEPDSRRGKRGEPTRYVLGDKTRYSPPHPVPTFSKNVLLNKRHSTPPLPP